MPSFAVTDDHRNLRDARSFISLSEPTIIKREGLIGEGPSESPLTACNHCTILSTDSWFVFVL
jgi:hypothetical protein